MAELKQCDSCHSKPVRVDLEQENVSNNWFASIGSDYSPDTRMIISITDNNDIAIKITGDGELRITTSDRRFSKEDLGRIADAFKNLLVVFVDVLGCNLSPSG